MTRTRRRGHFLARAIALAAVLATPADAAEPLPLELREIANGLFAPTAIASPRDGSGRLFVTEIPGTIRIFDDAQLLPSDFLDITALVGTGGERGLLGLAFHPEYATNGYFYVHYSRALDGDATIARYSVDALDPNAADPSTALVVLVVDQNGGAANHNGGDMHFGPDGLLYVAFGDDGGGGDPLANGQDPSTLPGSLIRIDVDSPDPGLAYGIPPSNPFVGVVGARAEIWAYGLRNPWRFSFDRATGDLFIADVGQDRWEEVNVQPASSPGGENYGWNCREGAQSFSGDPECASRVLVDPTIVYAHAAGTCNNGGSGSITGGYRYRGVVWAGLRDQYIYADYCTGAIYQAVETSPGVFSASPAAAVQRSITTFGEDEDGELYAATGGGVLYALPEPSGAASGIAAIAALAGSKRAVARRRRSRALR